MTYNQKTFPDNITRVHATGDTTIETAGPYFVGSNPIKFSDIGKYFKNSGYISGQPVKASEYFRNTNPSDSNANVPNATENEFESDKVTAKIAGDNYSGSQSTFSGNGTNLRIGSFRGSIKRYYATLESGIYQNYSMARWTGSKGIDWDNRNHRDTTSRSDGNLTRNVEKSIFINGTCYSDDTGTNGFPGSLVNGEFDKEPGAGLVEPSLSIFNTFVYVNGSIYGAGGLGGFRTTGNQGDSDPGKHGGTALKIKHTGETTFVYVAPNGKLYGGGGGGESGAMGDPGAPGSCGESYVDSFTVSFCPINESGGFVLQGCPAGYESSGWSGNGPACSVREDGSVRAYEQSVTCSRDMSADYGSSSTPTQGRGGAGGDGASYSHSTGRPGLGGTPGEAPFCSQGSLSGGRPSGSGERGGDGGNYGQAGANTNGTTGDGGNGGPAVCGSPFLVLGSVNANTLKGKYDGECDGTAQTIDPQPNPNPPDAVITQAPQYARFHHSGMKLMVTSPTELPNQEDLSYLDEEENAVAPATFKFRMKTQHFDRDTLDNIPFRSVTIKDLNGQVRGKLERRGGGVNPSEIVLDLEDGEYLLEWENLNKQNTNLSGSDGYNGNGFSDSSGTVVNLDQIDEDMLGMNLKDSTSPDVDATIEILDFNPSASTWIRSYDPSFMSEKPDGTNWEYPAQNAYWEQFMRDYAVYPSFGASGYEVTDANLNTYHQEVYPVTFTNATNRNRKPVGAIDVTPGNNFKLKMMSDNDARLYLDGVLMCQTSTFFGHDGFQNFSGLNPDGNFITEKHISDDITIDFPGDITSRQFNIKAEIRNYPFDNSNPPVQMTKDWKTNPAGIAWVLEDGTGNVVFDSTKLPGTERLSPATVSFKVLGTSPGTSGYSVPVDPSWGNLAVIDENNQAIGLRLAPGKSIVDANGKPAHNISYHIVSSGTGIDRTDNESFNIR